MSKELNSMEIYALDSFKALCKDIGVDLNLPIKTIVIRLDQDQLGEVDTTFYAHKNDRDNK